MNEGSIVIPELPPARGREAVGRAELPLRYEDVTQDGRVVLTALMPGLGAAVWRNVLASGPTLDAFRAQGILPILRRLVVVGEPGPFSVHAPLAYEGTWRLARDPEGGRLFLNMWLEARAPHGQTLAPAPSPDAPRALVGRVFAEHVITRPFAPPEERKVTRLDAPDLPAVPEDPHPFLPAEALVEGRPLRPAGRVRFGLTHTDSNQHVNSLVYPRLFEELALQSGALEPTALARAIELRWRKPFFAGDDADLTLATEGDTLLGAFCPAGSDRVSCTVAMRPRP